MTHAEIEAQRTRDYKFLGRFLGIADFAKETSNLQLVREALLDALREYNGESAEFLPAIDGTEVPHAV